jgi:glycerophosphoryl diester phosphodiesterase
MTSDRKTTKVIDGVTTTGWFTTDFTLAELKTLHAIERLPDIRQHNTLYDGLWQVRISRTTSTRRAGCR